MIKKILGFGVLLMFLAGCAQCTVMRSEYFDITGEILEPKSSREDIQVFETAALADRPYETIGSVKVVARWDTPRPKLVEEMKKRARIAGADALIDVQYVEDRASRFLLCGRLSATKRSVTATATTIIFKD